MSEGLAYSNTLVPVVSNVEGKSSTAPSFSVSSLNVTQTSEYLNSIIFACFTE